MYKAVAHVQLIIELLMAFTVVYSRQQKYELAN